MKVGLFNLARMREVLESLRGYIPDNIVLRHLTENLVCSDFVGALDITDDGMIKFLQSKWDYNVVPSDDKKWQITKPGVTLNKVITNDIPQATITEFVEKYKMVISQNKQSIEIVDGDKLLWSYLDSNANNVSSCMGKSNQAEKLQFYTNNNVKLIRVMQKGKIQARALLWEDVEYKEKGANEIKKGTLLDRIYPDNGTGKDMIMEYAKSHRFLIQAKAREPIFVKLDKGGTKTVFVRYKVSPYKGIYPYIDTLCFVNNEYASNIPPLEGKFAFARHTSDAYKFDEFDASFLSKLDGNQIESNTRDLINEMWRTKNANW